MTTVTFTLPDYLADFLDADVAARAPLKRNELIEQLVLKAYLDKHPEDVEGLLLQGIKSGPPTPMTKQDWAAIRSRVRERLASLNADWPLIRGRA